jgi:hypothetical protein
MAPARFRHFSLPRFSQLDSPAAATVPRKPELPRHDPRTTVVPGARQAKTRLQVGETLTPRPWDAQAGGRSKNRSPILQHQQQKARSRQKRKRAGKENLSRV